MKISLALSAVLSVAAAALAVPAYAQDQCRDVLNDGVYSYETYRDDSYSIRSSGRAS